MMMENNVRPHIPVMLKEVLECLAPKAGTYVDATFGEGGYSRAILEEYEDAKVIAFDQDPYTIIHAEKLKLEFAGRFKFVNENFIHIPKYLDESVDGIVFDLGVSTHQILSPDRGFSFDNDGALDMRMSQSGSSAFDIVNNFPEQELADIIFQYGDETQSRKIARYIVNSRVEKPLNTTFELANIVSKAKGGRGHQKIHPATKTFQAIRIFVNDELDALRRALANNREILKIGARLVVVSFHSLEDSIVKKYLQNNSSPKIAQSKYHLSAPTDTLYLYDTLTRKPRVPNSEEIRSNNSARSAKLRAAIKISSGRGNV